MDMKQLEIFVTACERGSFSQAAACMYMTQPNISKSIRALEHELETQRVYSPLPMERSCWNMHR